MSGVVYGHSVTMNSNLGVTRQGKKNTLRHIFRVQLDNIKNYASVIS